jgi:hypothetical protein
MHRLAVFSSLHRGSQLAAAVECDDPTHLGFVGVYPLDLSAPATRQFLRNRGFDIFPETGRAYHVRTFEVDRSLVEADRSISESDLINPASLFAFDDEQLAEELIKLNVPVERLEPPYKSDYPI